ncbi:PIN domain-containing protein [Agrobacterium vitis]|uniref:type II toxin-antitoxin system VapC family toxin n=1 Tax=Rhizobium/Agrobacterium group TaxID=227290 RepID=UPI0008DC1E27|nr:MULTISPECIES: type II toxin-antitoxin system VapC family toxin [Rhizobium/Agrobacterium group]MCF1434387.1 type II toxin-antitoxin system VapC family toxin [Allorhizobium ampelinum]MUO89460.1 PIN domain-containing protein [Agrobacterium vitis]MUZ51602.1 PIN domain-containing protein [Agrobacterium vitis]MUZ90181.1 PIN domain-containing protein [Agrobacterium vitis]MVA39204.1 PIN domain-containing protein [Agrobacterium vitis]
MITARYMLDTNIISDVVRNPMGRAADVMHGLNRDDICLSSIVLSEILFGIQRKGSERLTRLVEGVLERIAVIAYDDLAGRHYAEIRTTLEKQGTPIGATDLFIAAHALSLDMVLVTNNTREFARVSGLKLENWLETATEGQ